MGATATTAAANAACDGVTLEATDTGVTADTITIQVMADTGSPLAPGLFQGNVDALKGFEKYINANGGIGCRQLKVEAWDSKLTPDESKNGQINACATALAMVGGNSLFNPDVTEMNTCADAGRSPRASRTSRRWPTTSTSSAPMNAYIIQGISETCPADGTLPSGQRDLTAFVGHLAVLPDDRAEPGRAVHGAGRPAHHRAVGHLPDRRPGRGRRRVDRCGEGVGS